MFIIVVFHQAVSKFCYNLKEVNYKTKAYPVPVLYYGTIVPLISKVFYCQMSIVAAFQIQNVFHVWRDSQAKTAIRLAGKQKWETKNMPNYSGTIRVVDEV